MTNALQKLVTDLEAKFEGLWADLKPHVVPDAEAAAKQVVDSAKADVGQLAIAAGQDLRTEWNVMGKTVDEVAREAAQAVNVPLSDLPAAQRPPTAAELASAAGAPATADTTTVPASSVPPAAMPSVPAPGLAADAPAEPAAPAAS
jgi:hypothetical protein